MGIFNNLFEKTPAPPTFDELWKELVPAVGQADTVQGELIRAIGRMTDEFACNGYANWDGGYEILSAFLAGMLTDGTFGPQTSAGVRRDIEMIQRYAHHEKITFDLESAHERLRDATVAWCAKHPEPIAHSANANLKR